MTDSQNRLRRRFLFLALLGVACFVGLECLAAYSKRERMVLVMALYFGGIGFSFVGVLGWAGVSIKMALQRRRERATAVRE